MLLVSWKEKMQSPAAPVPVHSVSLYHSEMKAYAALSVDSTHSNHYRFTALESCSSYAACVEMAGSHSLTCLSTITGTVGVYSLVHTVAKLIHWFLVNTPLVAL